MTFKEIQGNSVWINVTCETYADVDPIWTNYTGKWDIQDSTGAVKANGTMTPNALGGVMYIRIPAADTRALAVGSYILTSQIYNTTIGYEEERHDKLTISATERIV